MEFGPDDLQQAETCSLVRQAKVMTQKLVSVHVETDDGGKAWTMSEGNSHRKQRVYQNKTGSTNTNPQVSRGNMCRADVGQWEQVRWLGQVVGR